MTILVSHKIKVIPIRDQMAVRAIVEKEVVKLRSSSTVNFFRRDVADDEEENARRDNEGTLI